MMHIDSGAPGLVSLGVSQTVLGRREQELGLDIIPLSVPSLLRWCSTVAKPRVYDATSDPRVYPPFVTELGIRSEMISAIRVAHDPRR